MFETVAMAKVSASALEAKNLGLLRDSDVVVFNAYELLYVAKQVANALAESGYRPPLPANAIPVAGDVGTATFKASLANMQAGYFVSPHDFDIAIAHRRHAVRRRDRARLDRRRGVAAGAGAQALRGAGEDARKPRPASRTP